MPREHTHNTRIEARITPDAMAVVKRAAELQGKSVSEFVAAAAQEVAHRAIEEVHLIRLSASEQKQFGELLLNPPPLSPALERAKDSHASLIQTSR